MGISENLFVVIHNVHSRSRVKEFAQVAAGMGCQNIVISKASGSAASQGVPEAYKAVHKFRKNILFLANLEDVIELLKPDKIFVITSSKYAKEKLIPDEIRNSLGKNRVLVVVGGTSPGLTRRDLDLGTAVHCVSTQEDIGPIATIAIFLNQIELS